MAFEKLFGKTLVKKFNTGKANDVVDTTTALGGQKQVGLYFSAHWCPPCRGFTPQLAKQYNAMKAKGQKFEIVFVSGDKDEKTCAEYHDEMPWLALDFADRAKETELSKLFKVQGIPTLVILDGSGNLVSTKGRSFISSDADFPFKPPTLKSSLGSKLNRKNKDGTITEVATDDALKGKNVALYFSAHWCPPCRGFTPKLAELYKKMRAQVAAGKRKDDFEFVFVSSDRDDKAFAEYYGEMPWCALPFSNRKGKAALSDLFDVKGIPSLVTLEYDSGTVINKAARGGASGDPEGAEFPWYPKPCNDVNDVTDGLNDEICVVVLLDGASDADKTKRMNNLKLVASKYYAEAKEKKTDPKYRFFFESEKGGVSGQIRSLTSCGDGAKTIVLDLGDSGSYYNASKEGDVEAVLSDFENGKLEKKKASR